MPQFDSAIFDDLIVFLNQAKDRSLELTATGNLKLKVIHHLGGLFRQDIYHRGLDGSIMFSIRSEDSVRPLHRIRGIAELMKLVRKHKDRLLLTRKGKQLLELPPDQAYITVVGYYLYEFNWCYVHPTLLWLELFQQDQADVWHFLGKQGQAWTQLSELASLIQNLVMVPDPESWMWEIKDFGVGLGFVDEMSLLGLIDYECVKEKTFLGFEVKRLRLSQFGRWYVANFFGAQPVADSGGDWSSKPVIRE